MTDQTTEQPTSAQAPGEDLVGPTPAPSQQAARERQFSLLAMFVWLTLASMSLALAARVGLVGLCWVGIAFVAYAGGWRPLAAGAIGGGISGAFLSIGAGAEFQLDMPVVTEVSGWAFLAATLAYFVVEIRLALGM